MWALAAAGGSRGDAEPARPHSCPRHPGARTMLPLLLLLLATAHALSESCDAIGLGALLAGVPCAQGHPRAWGCRGPDAIPILGATAGVTFLGLLAQRGVLWGSRRGVPPQVVVQGVCASTFHGTCCV